MEITCIVVEDEPLAMAKLLGFIEKVADLKVLATFDNSFEAINYLQANTVDLAYLDIQMEEFTGIQLLETLQEKPRVIITTAYDRYAVRGYELEVDDYLLKPFTLQRFLQATEKVRRRITEDAPTPVQGMLFVKTEYRLEKVLFQDILYLEGMSEYLKIVTTSDSIMTLQNFRTLERMLPAQEFCRVHKSWLVAIDKIDSIERSRIVIGDKLIPISETYKKPFFKRIGISK